MKRLPYSSNAARHISSSPRSPTSTYSSEIPETRIRNRLNRSRVREHVRNQQSLGSFSKIDFSPSLIDDDFLHPQHVSSSSSSRSWTTSDDKNDTTTNQQTNKGETASSSASKKIMRLLRQSLPSSPRQFFGYTTKKKGARPPFFFFFFFSNIKQKFWTFF